MFTDCGNNGAIIRQNQWHTNRLYFCFTFVFQYDRPIFSKFMIAMLWYVLCRVAPTLIA